MLDKLPWYAEMTKMMMPGASFSMRVYAEIESRLTLAQIALRIEDVRRREGRYPANLDSLGELPRDPYTGQPFEYRPEGEGFVLRSPTTEKRKGLVWTRTR